MVDRLPIPGQDDGTWGTILNGFLSQAHNGDGSLKSTAISAAGGLTSVADNSVGSTKLDTSVRASLARADSALQTAPVTTVAGRNGDVSLAQSDINGLTSTLAAKATTASLSSVATSGQYTDLLNKPAIPVAGTSSGTYTAGNDSRVTGAVQTANNLSDLVSAATARTNLGLGTAATQASASFALAAGPVPAAYAAVTDYRFTGTPTSKQVADFTLAVTDSGSIIEVEAATNVNVTVPPSYSVPLQGGTLIEISQTGAGQVTLVPATNVVLHNAAGLKTRTQWSSLSLRKRPGGGSALPLIGLLVRYRADDISGTSGSKVTSWEDSSGNNYSSAAQSTTVNQPTLVTNAINGHKGVGFNGTSQFLALSGAALGLMQNVAAVSVFVVYTCPTVSSGTRNLFSLSTGTAAATTRLGLQHRNSNGNGVIAYRRLDADAVGYAEGTAVTAGETVCLSGVIDFSIPSAKLYRNGTQSGTATPTSGVSSNTSSMTGAIGAGPDGTASLFYGTIAEILVYSVTNNSVRAAISTYVQNTYAISMADALSGTDEWVVTGDSSV